MKYEDISLESSDLDDLVCYPNFEMIKFLSQSFFENFKKNIFNICNLLLGIGKIILAFNT